MKVKILRTLGRNLPNYSEGQIVDVDDATGEMLRKRNLAELVDPDADDLRKNVKAVPEESLKAVPPEDRSAEQATRDLENYRDREKKKPHQR